MSNGVPKQQHGMFELMPRWVSKGCSALYCSDCFIFPFPERFLHCTVKTEGSKPGLIVNRVKRDIESPTLEPTLSLFRLAHAAGGA